MDYQDILRRPIITEKNTRLMEMNQYTFEVAPEANKIQIKEAVERTFNVKVKKVNTMNVRGKPRRRIRRRGRRQRMIARSHQHAGWSRCSSRFVEDEHPPAVPRDSIESRHVAALHREPHLALPPGRSDSGCGHSPARGLCVRSAMASSASSCRHT